MKAPVTNVNDDENMSMTAGVASTMSGHNNRKNIK